jgi:hypothetical protein
MPGDYQTGARMGLKLAAIPLSDFKGISVLDVGTDHGFFAFLASDRGATEVLGLDRNRVVVGVETDLIALNRGTAKGTVCQFEFIELGKQWRFFGRFDVVMIFSVYHHIYEAAGGDHAPVWFWLHRNCAPGGQVLWEGPLDDNDPVVRANISDENRRGYNRDAILRAAEEYFESEYIGPALHEPARQVWRFRPKTLGHLEISGKTVIGAGGATAAFEFADGRRIEEIQNALGFRAKPGSLNVQLSGPFWWNKEYVRARVLDVVKRGNGLDGEWAPRWARFYPVSIKGQQAWVFRFEGDRYPDDFVELIAPNRLRKSTGSGEVRICR